jgi:hypothetical protein
MLTVSWSVLKFSLIEIVPKGDHITVLYFRFKILHGIVKHQPADTAEEKRRSMALDFDHAALALGGEKLIR